MKDIPPLAALFTVAVPVAAGVVGYLLGGWEWAPLCVLGGWFVCMFIGGRIFKGTL